MPAEVDPCHVGVIVSLADPERTTGPELDLGDVAVALAAFVVGVRVGALIREGARGLPPRGRTGARLAGTVAVCVLATGVVLAVNSRALPQSATEALVLAATLGAGILLLFLTRVLAARHLGSIAVATVLGVAGVAQALGASGVLACLGLGVLIDRATPKVAADLQTYTGRLEPLLFVAAAFLVAIDFVRTAGFGS